MITKNWKLLAKKSGKCRGAAERSTLSAAREVIRSLSYFDREVKKREKRREERQRKRLLRSERKLAETLGMEVLID